MGRFFAPPGGGFSISDGLADLTNANIWTRAWSPVIGTANHAVYNNVTMHSVVKAPCIDFDQVQFLFKNNSTSTAYTYTSGICSATNAGSNDTERQNSSTGTWATITVNGQTSWQTPVRPSGDNAFDGTFTLSDWIALNSVAPTDGSAYPYLQVRTRVSGQEFKYMGHSGGRQYGDATWIQTYRSNANIDATTAPNNTFTWTSDSIAQIWAVNFRSSQTGLTWLCVGDSVMAGKGQNPGFSGFFDADMFGIPPYLETYFKQLGTNINTLNYGYPSANSTTYSSIGRKAIVAHRPQFCLYSVFTTNDGNITQTIADAAYDRMVAFAEFCKQSKVIPIMTFLYPNNNWPDFTDKIRKDLIARVKAAPYYCLDLTPSIGTGASPDRFISGVILDSIHPNYVGNRKSAHYAMPLLATFVAKNGFGIVPFPENFPSYTLNLSQSVILDTDTSDTVSAWQNTGPTGLEWSATQLTKANQPAWDGVQINEFPCATFDGSTELLSFTGDGLNLMRNIRYVSFLIVLDNDSASTDQDVISFSQGDSATTERFRFMSSTSAGEVAVIASRADADSPVTLNGGTATTGAQWFVVTYHTESRRMTVYKNGTQILQSTTFGTTGFFSDTASLAGVVGGSLTGASFSGSIAEIHAWQRELQSTDIPELAKYIDYKFGI